MALYWPQGWEDKYHKMWEANLQPLGSDTEPKNAWSFHEVFQPWLLVWSGPCSHKSWQKDPKWMSPNWLNVVWLRCSEYRRCKSFNSVWYSTTQNILPTAGTKTNHPKRWGWLVEEETAFPTNTRRCNGTSTNSPQSKVTNFFCYIFQMEA